MDSGIFDKEATLKPSAMATVAERRFGDAQVLVRTGKPKHANGAAYLAGFVIEILLKSQLVRKYPHIAHKRSSEISKAEREVWELIWRRHDLEKMLLKLHELKAALDKRGLRAGRNYVADLTKICGTWTIYARYSSRTMSVQEASDMLNRVRQLKELLK